MRAHGDGSPQAAIVPGAELGAGWLVFVLLGGESGVNLLMVRSWFVGVRWGRFPSALCACGQPAPLTPAGNRLYRDPRTGMH